MDLSIRRRLTIFTRPKLSEQHQLKFLKQLQRLLNNGYSLLDALDMFQWDRQLNVLAQRLIAYLKSGVPLDEAFSKVDFHHSVTALLYFTRIHGDLVDSLDKCITMLEQRLKAIRRFQQVIRYPLILLIFFIGLLISIKRTVLPSFINLYQSQGSVSPVLNFSIKFINIFFISLFIIMIIVISLTIFWLIYKRRITIDKLKRIYHNIPFVRHFMTLKTSYQFAVHLSSLLKTGLSPVKVLEIIAKQNEVPIVAHTAKLAIEKLLQGFSLSESIEHLLLIDKQFSYILRKNPNMETLEADLNMYVEMSQERIHDRVMKFISLIQPIFLIIIASFIIFLYVSLMWPMFQLIQTI